MLNDKQIDEIREHLEKAQNPLFFFDNDDDGLCSFLLLQR
jgi:single-stranded DNA-specific DHH superfamily exonuclease